MSKRKSLERRYSGIYSVPTWISNSDMRFTCFYCGDPAQSVDHVPPLAGVEAYRALGVVEEYLKVPSCTECNSLLGDEVQETIMDRKDRIAELISKKYKKLMAFEEWDDCEISELSGNLKRMVEASSDAKKWSQGRVDFSGGINLYVENRVEEQ